MGIYSSSLKETWRLRQYPNWMYFLLENISHFWAGSSGKKNKFIIEKLVYIVRKVIVPE